MTPFSKVADSKSPGKPLRLGDLEKGVKARVRGIREEAGGLARRLLEMGILEGAPIEIIHEAPFSRDPIAVKARGTLIALRRQEANWIEVERDDAEGDRK
jgi:ferrous iron transport protein A